MLEAWIDSYLTWVNVVAGTIGIVGPFGVIIYLLRKDKLEAERERDRGA